MRDQEMKELGKLFAGQALEFLLGKAGGSAVELRDVATFYSSAVSGVAANAFVLILQKAGPLEAEKLLRQALAGISANIRLLGAPVMVSLKAELTPIQGEPMPPDMPMPTPAPEPVETAAAVLPAVAPVQEPAAAASTPAPAPITPLVCACKLVDGECALCPRDLKAKYLNLGSFAISYLRTMVQKTSNITQGCTQCGARYADSVFAEIVKEGGITGDLSQEEEPLRDQALGIAIQTAAMFGVQEIPLTDQAIQERRKTS